MLLLAVAIGCPRAPSPVPAAPAAADPVDPGAQARQFALRAEAALARGDLAEARRWAGWLLRVDGSAWAAIHAAEALRDAGDLPAAEVAAARAVRADPDLLDAQRVLGLIRLERGDAAGASEALARAGDLPGVLPARIAAAAAAGDLGHAEQLLDGWAPEAASDRLAWATAARRAGRAAAARDVAVTLAHDPLVGPDALQLAVVAGHQACDLGPVHAWRHDHAALSADPRWREALLQLADLTGDGALARLVAARTGDRAAELLDRLAGGDVEGASRLLQEGDPPALRARVALARGDADAADAALQSATDPDSLALRADLRLAAGDAEGALALTDGASDGPLAWVRAGALVLVGRLDEAVALVVRTASDPADAAVREAAVRDLGGDPAGAERVLRELLAEPVPCPVAVWVALAERAPPCEAAELLASARRVRAADPGLEAAHAAARSACPALRER